MKKKNEASERKTDNSQEKNDILTIDDVSKMLGFSQSKIYKMIRENEIPCFKISSSWRFLKDDICVWLEKKSFQNTLVLDNPDKEWSSCVKRIARDKQIDAEYHMERNASEKEKMQTQQSRHTVSGQPGRQAGRGMAGRATVFDTLKRTGLFLGSSDREINDFLAANRPERRFFKKGEVVMLESQRIINLYIVESGSLAALLDLSDVVAPAKKHFKSGQTVGLDIMMSVFKTSYMDVRAEEDSCVILFNIEKIMKYMYERPAAFLLFSTNVMRLLSDENIRWMKQTRLLMERSVREKILYYMRLEERKSSGRTIRLTESRQELAAHLGINRAVLSKELVRMKEEGLIDYRKNTFIIKDKAHEIYRLIDRTENYKPYANDERIMVGIKDIDTSFETLEERGMRKETPENYIDKYLAGKNCNIKAKKRVRSRRTNNRKDGII